MRLHKIALIGLVIFAVALGGCIIDGSDSSLTLRNDSSYDIVEINITPTDAADWGPNLLGGDSLYPGESITIHSIDCDYYDVRITDDTGWDCITYDVDLCFDDDYWVITDSFLNNCG